MQIFVLTTLLLEFLFGGMLFWIVLIKTPTEFTLFDVPPVSAHKINVCMKPHIFITGLRNCVPQIVLSFL